MFMYSYLCQFSSTAKNCVLSCNTEVKQSVLFLRSTLMAQVHLMYIAIRQQPMEAGQYVKGK